MVLFDVFFKISCAKLQESGKDEICCFFFDSRVTRLFHLNWPPKNRFDGGLSEKRIRSSPQVPDATNHGKVVYKRPLEPSVSGAVTVSC